MLGAAAPVGVAEGTLEDTLEAAVVLANIAGAPQLATRAASVAQTAGLRLRGSFLRLVLSTCCQTERDGLAECAPLPHPMSSFRALCGLSATQG